MSILGKLFKRKAYRRKWQVGHYGRDAMYYEELIDERWERIEIDGEMLVGCEAHHVIYFESEDEWKAKYPTWAQGRREEIILRINSEFSSPSYEYHGV